MSNDLSSGTKPPSGFMSWASQYFQEAVTKIETTVENYTTAKDTYILELVKAENRVNSLRGKPGIDVRFGEIDAKLNAAKLAAGKSEYIEANKDLVQVLALHPDADQQSTDFESNQIEIPKNSNRVNTLKNHAGKNAIPVWFGEIEGKFKESESATLLNDHTLAKAKLAECWSLHRGNADLDLALEMADACAWYDNNLAAADNRFNSLNTHPGKRAIAVELGEIDTVLKDAKSKAASLDYLNAKTLLSNASYLHSPVAETKADACEWYDDNLTDVEDRLNDLNTRIGHKAIELERGQVDSKITEAKSKATALDFESAKTLLLAAKNLHNPAAENLAIKCESYFTKKTEWDGYMSTLKNRPQHAVVAAEISQLETDILGITIRAEGKQWKVLDGMLGSMANRWNAADKLREKCAVYKSDLINKEARVETLKNHISTHKRADSIAPEMVLLNGAITKAKGHADIAKREYDDAVQAMVDIPKNCDAAKLIADACEAYETKLVTANEKYSAVKVLKGIAKEADALNDKLQRAAALATNASRKFAEAEVLLDEVIAGCATATTLSEELGKFGTATGEAIKLGTISEACAELKKQVAALRLLLPQILGVPSHDAIQAQLGEIDVAIDAVPADSTEKPDVALKVPSEQCMAANLAIRRIIDLGYADAREEAVGKITPLEARCKDTLLAPKAAELKTGSLAASDLKATSEDYSAAIEFLAKLTAECLALTLVADQMDKYTTDRPGLDTKVNDLEPKRPQIGGEIDDLKKLLEEAKTKADVADYVAAVAKLGEVKKGLTLIAKLVDVKDKIATPPTNDTEFQTLKASCLELMAQPGGAGKVDAIVAALPAKAQRYVMMALMMARFDLTEFKQFKSDKIWNCHWAGCDGRNYEGDTKCKKCNKTREYWTCGHSPCKNKNQWVANCEACGLDDSGCVEGEAKIESSYDTKNLVADDYTKENKSIKRLYEVFKMVPDSQTKENDKLKKIIRYKDNTGGAAYGGDTIYMHCGKAGDDGSIDYAEQLLPGSPKYQEFFPAPDPSAPEGDARKDMYQMDPKCQPKAGTVDPGKKKPYFDFATLHEIGHAVDDKKQFMAKNSSKDEYGGWINYGGDVTKIAKIANDHFQFNQAYIEERLSGNTPVLPVALVDSRALTDQQWLDLRAKVDDWCDGIKEDKSLWWDGSNSARLSIGGRVYQEAYAGTWVSYKLSARNKGIHGYQFRAPGEWFAEIYAAYHSKILKDDHPSVSWLSKL